MLKTFSCDKIFNETIIGFIIQRILKKEGSMLAQGKLLRNVLIMNMDMQLEDISESMSGL